MQRAGPPRRQSAFPSNRDAPFAPHRRNRSDAGPTAGVAPTAAASPAGRPGGAPARRPARAGVPKAGSVPPSNRKGLFRATARSFSEQPRRLLASNRAKVVECPVCQTQFPYMGKHRSRPVRRETLDGGLRDEAHLSETHTRPASNRFPAASSDSLVEWQLSGRPA